MIVVPFTETDVDGAPLQVTAAHAPGGLYHIAYSLDTNVSDGGVAGVRLTYEAFGAPRTAAHVNTSVPGQQVVSGVTLALDFPSTLQVEIYTISGTITDLDAVLSFKIARLPEEQG